MKRKPTKPPYKRPGLMRQMRRMYELDVAGDKLGAREVRDSLPAEVQGVLCLVMFYGRCWSPRLVARMANRRARRVDSGSERVADG